MNPLLCGWAVGAGAVLGVAGTSHANFTVDYTVDVGGINTNPLNGLSARATWRVSGTTLTILLENTSTGIPLGSEVSDSLLASIAFNLGSTKSIVSGDSAVIGPGSVGLGQWSALGPGASVGDEWLWSNDGGGDLLENFSQLISTSMGADAGTTTSFEGVPNPNVGGPFGGIAANPPILGIPANQMAVSDSILFTLTLDTMLSNDQLKTAANGAFVEFGSDFQYLGVPGPGALPLLVLPALVMRRRRRPSA